MQYQNEKCLKFCFILLSYFIILDSRLVKISNNNEIIHVPTMKTKINAYIDTAIFAIRKV